MALRVGIIGLGRAGSLAAKKIIEEPTMSVVLAAVRDGDKRTGRDLGKFLKKRRYRVKISGISDLRETIRKSKPKVIVDFTRAQAFMQNIRTIADTGVSVVIGTTGFTKKQTREIRGYANEIGIIFAPNLTEGMCVMMVLSRIAAMMLPSADIDIVETHHRLKNDTPSGTARLLLEQLNNDAKRTKNRRSRPKINVHSIRAGGSLSKHEVQFTTPTQALSLKHETIFQDVFGSGVIKAARYIADKKGFHSMEEVLGLDQLIAYVEKMNKQGKLRSIGQESRR